MGTLLRSSRVPLLLVLGLVVSGVPRLAGACRFELVETDVLALPSPAPASRFVVADLDGDGLDDVIVTLPGCPGSVHVVRTTPTGFAPPVVLGIGEGLGGVPAGVDVADVDADGDLDIAVGHLESSCGERGVTVFYQDAAGVFSAAVTWPGDGDGRVLRAADLDGSGLPVLVTGDGPFGLNPTTGKAVQVRENSGPGSFAHVHEYGLQPPGALPGLIAIGTLGDGAAPDILVFWPGGREVGSLCNFGDHTFEETDRWTLNLVGPPGGAAAADLDEDGRLDLLVSIPSRDRLSLHRATATGECPLPSRNGDTFTSTDGIESVLAVDLDADGKLDVVGAVPARGQLALHGGTGRGAFGPLREVEIGGSPRLMAAGAFDADSRTDLVVLDDDGSLRLLANRSETDRCPVARTAGVVSAQTEPTTCDGPVPVDGSRSFDLDDQPLTYLWYEAGDLILETDDPVDEVTLERGTHQLVLIVRDSGGLESRPAALEARVVDATPADLSAPPPAPVECAGLGRAFVTLSASATDACGPVTIASTFGLGDTVARPFPVGVSPVLWTATDSSGNSTQVSVDVVVLDSAPPAWSCPDEVVVPCAGGEVTHVDLVATVADQCSPLAELAVQNDRGCGGTDASGFFPLGETTVTFTAVDPAGNVGTCETRVAVLDEEPPALLLPSSPIRLECSGPSGAATGLVAAATDACSGVVVLTNDRTGSVDASGTYPLGATTVTWTSTDAAGNASEGTTVVEVVDGRPPVVSCPVEVTAACPVGGAAFVPLTADVTDCCDPSVSVVNDHGGGGADASGLYAVGTTLVRFDAVDASGNAATCETRVVVGDDAPPIVACPASVETECLGGAGTPVALVAFAFDDCDGSPVVVNDRTSGGADATDVYPVGTTRVRFQATDAGGHAASCETEVVVADTRAPIALAETEDACLWPPNHRFVRFALGEHLRVAATDLCAAPEELTVAIESVTSNELDDGAGDGTTAPDIVILGDAVYLRAERSGRAPGREYAVVLSVSDPSGNLAEATVTVRVPHGGRAPEGCRALPPDRFVDDDAVLP